MWCDQAKSVGSRNIDFKKELNKAESVFSIVFCILQLLISVMSVEPIVQFQFLQNVAVEMVHSVKKWKLKFTDFKLILLDHKTYM